MSKKRKYNGFSLVEVLLAVGTLAIGMIFIGGTFIVGIHLTTVSTERTTASIAAGEAFAKMRLYLYDANDPNRPFDLSDPSLVPPAAQERFELVHNAVMGRPMNPDEFAYPSTPTLANKQYYWSALCRLAPSYGPTCVQVTVFVSRKVGSGTRYWVRDQDPAVWPGLIQVPYPQPVDVNVVHDPAVHSPYEVSIDDLNPGDRVDEATFINDGYTIVENTEGQIYRVVKRYADDPGTPTIREDLFILLDRPWDPDGVYPDPDSVWVVPPPITGGRGPCIAVYQTVIRF